MCGHHEIEMYAIAVIFRCHCQVELYTLDNMVNVPVCGELGRCCNVTLSNINAVVLFTQHRYPLMYIQLFEFNF